jgi:hypothetical protein
MNNILEHIGLSRYLRVSSFQFLTNDPILRPVYSGLNLNIKNSEILPVVGQNVLKLKVSIKCKISYGLYASKTLRNNIHWTK